MSGDTKKTKAQLIAELQELRQRLDQREVALDGCTVETDRFRKMVDGLPQIIFEMDLKGRFTYTNTFALKTFGYTRDDIETGLNINQIIHPDQLMRAKANMLRVLKGDDSPGLEYLAVRKDGSTLPIKIYSQAVIEHGHPMTIRGVVFDVSDIRQAQEALEERNRYYRTLFENTGTAMVIFGSDTILRSCNAQFEALSGYSRRELEGKMAWTTFVDPDDLRRMREYHQKRLNKADNSPEDYEFTFLTRDGTRKNVHLFLQVIPGTDERICSLIDITERKRTQEALRRSEQRYALVVRGANDGIWDWDLATDAVYFSPRYKAILGYNDREFPNVADSWKKAVHPDDLDRVVGVNMECIRGEVDQFEVEYRMRHKSGSYKWIQGRGASARDEEGNVYRLAGTHTDITQRKRTEDALRQSEQRYRDLFTHASYGVYQCSPKGAFINANPAMAEMMGYDSPRDFIQSVSDISRECYVNPEDRDEFLRKLKEFGVLNNYQVHLKRKDGSRIWASEDVRAVYDDDGEFIFYEGFIRDITARKLHERTSQALYAISKAIATTQDLQELYEHIHSILGKVINASNFFIGLLDREEDRIALDYFEDEKDKAFDIRNVSDPRTKSLTAFVIRSGKPLLLSRDGHIAQEVLENIGHVGTAAAVWLGVPLRARGIIIGAMAVQHYTDPRHYTETDVTFMEAVSEQIALAIERKRAEEELNELNEELESMVEQRTGELQTKAAELEAANLRLKELDEVKSALISSISHELRTPLTSIRGFAKLTSKDFMRHFLPLVDDAQLASKGERIRHNLDIIETEGIRLTRLINDFLDLNRIESGKATWNDAFLNPCEVIHRAVQAVSGAFAAKEGVKLVADLPKTVPPIHADPDKIQQVLINLLNNAYKFTSEGSVTVSVTPNPDSLTISVTDTGMGIPAKEKARIFEKFHKSRSGDTVSTKDKGTGLGLAICKEIVEHYEGSIWVDSTIGRGSTFSFTLPTVPGAVTACI